MSKGTPVEDRARKTGSAEEAVFLELLRTCELLSRGPAQVIKQADLSATQYNVLRILRGSEPEGLCRNDLRDRMLTRMPDVTRLLDRMQEAGLVTRERGDSDKRMVTTRVTKKGLELLATLDPIVRDRHREYFRGVTPDQLKVLIGLLEGVRDSARG
jgi:DNA-binding MarR family transcriptional regulator